MSASLHKKLLGTDGPSQEAELLESPSRNIGGVRTMGAATIASRRR
jgi:hypothetical protein